MEGYGLEVQCRGAVPSAELCTSSRDSHSTQEARVKVSGEGVGDRGGGVGT